MTSDRLPKIFLALVVTVDALSLLTGNLTTILLTVLASPIYFLPVLLAELRRHHQLPAIVGLTLLLGWTFLGWIAAVVWSLTAPRPAHSSPPSS
jgi:hypothetical protein